MVGKGRPKTFDNYEALEKATKIFWEKGYEGVSMTDLVDNMEISRQSLYNTFGNKHELFIKSLEYYIHEHFKKMRDMFEGPLPAKIKLENLFQMLEENYTCSKSKGCFGSFAIQEMSQKDPSVKKILDAKYERNYKLFFDFFSRSLKNGEIESDLNEMELTDLFDSILLSTTSLCKLTGRSGQIKNIFSIFMKQIKFNH